MDRVQIVKTIHFWASLALLCVVARCWGFWAGLTAWAACVAAFAVGYCAAIIKRGGQ